MNEHRLMRIVFSVALFTGFSSYAAAQPGRVLHSGNANSQILQKHDASKPVRGKNKPVNPGVIRGFNPQPEPPGHSVHGSPQGPGTTKAIIDDNNDQGHGTPENPGTTHGFNPQPEPPG